MYRTQRITVKNKKGDSKMKREVLQPKWVSLFLIGFCAMFALGVVGCGSAKSVRNPNYDYSKLRKIAILQLSGPKKYADIVTNNLTFGLIEAGYTVVERAQASKILEEHGMTGTGMMNEEEMAKAGRLLGADAIMLGAVTKVNLKPDQSNVFEASFNPKEGIGNAFVRLVDVETGALIAMVKFKNSMSMLYFNESEDAICNKLMKELLAAIKP